PVKVKVVCLSVPEHCSVSAEALLSVLLVSVAPAASTTVLLLKLAEPVHIYALSLHDALPILKLRSTPFETYDPSLIPSPIEFAVAPQSTRQNASARTSPSSATSVVIVSVPAPDLRSSPPVWTITGPLLQFRALGSAVLGMSSS